MATQRYTRITLAEMSLAEKLKAETAAQSKAGVANEAARKAALKKALPGDMDCDVKDVPRALAERAEQAKRASSTGYGR